MKIEDVLFKVAVGIGGGYGCVIALDKGSEDVKIDIEEYGASLEDLFFEGAVIPKEAGVYCFDGSAHGIQGNDENYRYEGEFKLLKI